MSAESTPVCPQCGGSLPANTPAGLCPRCLMVMNMATQTDIAGETGSSTARKVSPPPGTPAPEAIAKSFPQLEIIECLGRGGMGVVYKARQPRLGRLVALKILAPEREKDPEFAGRFEKEAQALARLSHPNIVTIHDFGEAGGMYYLLMEFVDGVTLRQLLGTSRVSPREALAIVPQICDALQFAHDHGIVHRDIKPENILLDRLGRVKVADFGLAKLVGTDASLEPGVTSADQPGRLKPGLQTNLTDAGKIMGTPQYMAPEQVAHPAEVDHRADIYALGVVFYQMLTGELPGKHIEPPSRKVHVDVRLDEVVLRALESNPELRFQQASAFKTQVESISAAAGSPAENPARPFDWRQGVDYRSKATLFGLPWLHVVSGNNPATGRPRVAKGIIAIGGIAKGVIAVGGMATGVFAFGGLAIGVFAYGGLALGLISFGGLAIALAAAFGGLAIAPLALGGGAIGYYSCGGTTYGIHFSGANAADAAGKAFFDPWAKDFMHRLFVLNNALVVVIVLLASGLPLWLMRRNRLASAESGSSKSKTPPRLSRAQSVVLIGLDILLGLGLVLIGWAVNAAGVFFNSLVVLILLMVVVRMAAIFWHVFHGALESGLLRTPFARGLHWHRWQLLNGWIFWLLAGLTLELCIVPAQFTPREYSLIRLVDWGGIVILMLLGFLPGRRVFMATNLAFTVGSIFMASQMARIYWPVSKTEGVILAAPFRGEWLVLNGGPSALINVHYDFKNQRDALDLERIVNGQEQTGDRQKLASYPSWGVTLYAPADGKIATVVNDLDDNPIGQADEEHWAGNHIAIDLSNDRYVMMAHLQKGSILVAKGEIVHAGQPIAKCGNSGNTSGPHLHLQVQNLPDFSAPGLKTYPILFRDVTCLRSQRPRADAPFFVRRNDQIISEAPTGILEIPGQTANRTKPEQFSSTTNGHP